MMIQVPKLWEPVYELLQPDRLREERDRTVAAEQASRRRRVSRTALAGRAGLDPEMTEWGSRSGHFDARSRRAYPLGVSTRITCSEPGTHIQISFATELGTIFSINRT